MTANPFAALLRHVEAFTFKGNVPQPDAHGKWVRRKDVIAALAAAVPADMAEAGKVAELGERFAQRLDPLDVIDPLEAYAGRSADTIRNLIARIAALEAQMKRGAMLLEATMTRAEAAETALAAERAKVAKLVEALTFYSCKDGCNDCSENERDLIGCGWTARAAITEAGQ